MSYRMIARHNQTGTLSTDETYATFRDAALVAKHRDYLGYWHYEVRDEESDALIAEFFGTYSGWKFQRGYHRLAEEADAAWGAYHAGEGRPEPIATRYRMRV